MRNRRRLRSCQLRIRAAIGPDRSSPGTRPRAGYRAVALDNGYYVMRYYVARSIRMTDPSLLILASLADGEKHGYAMMADIRSFADVVLGPGTLYGAITRLEQRGYIRAVAGDERRRPYRLTAAGRRHLQVELAALESVVRVGLQRLEPV